MALICTTTCSEWKRAGSLPEILEIEYYRRSAESVLGRKIVAVDAPDDWFLKGVSATDVCAALVGTSFVSFRRRGKLMLCDTAAGPVLGLRYGMTGRVIVDGGAPIEKLEYGSGRNDPAWIRFAVSFGEGRLEISDPRRLGGVSLDPDEDALGPDAWSISEQELHEALGTGARRRSTMALKARLLDQKRLAGLGNLLSDEILWRTGLAPERPAAELSGDDVALLADAIVSTLDELSARGGSHTGDLQEERNPDGRCPRDGAELRRAEVGGRTTWWCPEHQV